MTPDFHAFLEPRPFRPPRHPPRRRHAFARVTAAGAVGAALAIGGMPGSASSRVRSERVAGRGDPHVLVLRRVQRGDRRVLETTHGDPLHEIAYARMASTSSPAEASDTTADGSSGFLSTQACGPEIAYDDTTDSVDLLRPQYKVIYAYPADQQDRYTTYANTIAQVIAGTEQVISDASGGALGLRVDEGTSCGPQYLDIESVRLPRTLSAYQALGTNVFSGLTNDVHQQMGPLPAGQRMNVVIFADYIGQQGFPYAGQGTLYEDDSPGPSNASNSGGSVAVVYGNGGSSFVDSSVADAIAVTTHEIFHTLGAVQSSAPYATGAGHCWLEWDFMCYADGGPTAQPLQYDCAGSYDDAQLDCENQDYWSPSRVPGSYLASHWNTRDNDFICQVGLDCDNPATRPTAQIAGPAVFTDGDTATYSATGSSTPNGQIYTYQWVAGPGLMILGSNSDATVTVTDESPAASYLQLMVADSDGITSSPATMQINIQPTPQGGWNGTGNGSGNTTTGASGPSTRRTVRSRLTHRSGRYHLNIRGSGFPPGRAIVVIGWRRYRWRYQVRIVRGSFSVTFTYRAPLRLVRVLVG